MHIPSFILLCGEGGTLAPKYLDTVYGAIEYQGFVFKEHLAEAGQLNDALDLISGDSADIPEK